METGYSDAVVTLVTIANGTVSLYFSNGGGIIGVGEYEGPRNACHSLLSLAPKFIKYAKRTQTFPLPKEGNTRFYFLTYNGIYTVEKKEDDLGNNRLPLSPLFLEAHEVITQARIVENIRQVLGEENFEFFYKKFKIKRILHVPFEDKYPKATTLYMCLWTIAFIILLIIFFIQRL